MVAQSGLELDSVSRSRSDAMPLLRVIVDAPVGAEDIDSDTLASVSRAVSKALDEADPIDGEYLLEVSTPGAERELTKVGHWLRQIGRLVRIKLRAGGIRLRPRRRCRRDQRNDRSRRHNDYH